MSIPKEHFKDTYELIKKIDKNIIADWLLTEGYYPEQYVLPPCFHVKSFSFNPDPYFKVKTKRNGKKEFKPTISEIITISFPKSHLTERTFGIIEPTIYHDIVWYLINEWKDVLEHLFHEDINIFSYSFPIPVTKKNEGQLGKLRPGRMIYEFIEMAENDLVAEAHKFKYLLKTDVKNFYPSIYTHSIPWALLAKSDARKDIGKFDLLGSKIDKLLQSSDDRCTNGIPIGSAISDIISEILLARVDRELSKELDKHKIKYIGVRFKDDYRFLCSSKKDADFIVKNLQNELRFYKLSLSEDKTEIKELPEGLFRPWTSEYQKYSLKHVYPINYKRFETSLLAVLNIDKKYPNTGIIDKFLSELTSKKYNLKLLINPKEVFKVFSLLFLLKERRAKSFPQILAIIELIIKKFKSEEDIIKKIEKSLYEIFKSFQDDVFENQYDLLWFYYFLRSNGFTKKRLTRASLHPFINSLKSNSQKFFNGNTNIILFEPIKAKGKNKKLIEHLAIFPNEEDIN